MAIMHHEAFALSPNPCKKRARRWRGLAGKCV